MPLAACWNRVLRKGGIDAVIISCLGTYLIDP